MPTEIEAKIKVTPKEYHKAYEALRHLNPLDNEFHAAVLETNTYFDRRKTLDKSGKALRTRQTLNANGVVEQIITYKGPLLKGKYKSREELELPIKMAGTNIHTLQNLLPAIGFIPTIAFHKRRQECSVVIRSGDPAQSPGTSLVVKVKVAFDQLPTIGHFIEVEGEDNADIKYALEIMGLAGHKIIKQGYPSLLRKKFPKQIGILFAPQEMESL